MKIQANGLQINYETAGESGPSVVLVHGLGGSAAQWGGVAAALAPTCRVLMPELRGHGQSDKPPGPYALKHFVDDLGAFCDALKIERALVVGASMSGALVLQLAAERPSLIQGVVPLGGFGVQAPAGKERMSQRAAAVEAQGLSPAVVDAILGAALGATTHATRPALVALQKALMAQNDPRAYAAATRAVAEIDVQSFLPRVKCPTLLLFGAEEKVAPWTAQAALKKSIPHAQVRAVPEAGHLAFVERPAEVAAALMDFLATL